MIDEILQKIEYLERHDDTSLINLNALIDSYLLSIKYDYSKSDASLKFTTSRDAIKLIRPKHLNVSNDFTSGPVGMGRFFVSKIYDNAFCIFASPELATEEFAELYVTLKSIAWLNGDLKEFSDLDLQGW